MIVRLNPLPIRFHCYKVLPLVYDEALSYYEQLCKITKSLNDSIKSINDLNDAVTDLGSNVTLSEFNYANGDFSEDKIAELNTIHYDKLAPAEFHIYRITNR